jgi:hypothetical protein
MLLQYHSNILLIALYILNKNNNNNNINNYDIFNKLTVYNVKTQKEIYNNIDFTKIIIKNNDIDLLFSGLIFPDLTCGTFYIENGRIIPKLNICKLTQLKLSSNEQNVDSQLFQSHNDYFAINHSMANDVKLTNLQTRNLIIERILSIAYEFLTTNKFDFLGYLLHIIQDSWSGGHVTRVNTTNTKNTLYTKIDNIVSEITNKTQMTFVLNKDNLSYINISNIINVILSNDDNNSVILNYVKQNKSIGDIINIILNILINVCKEKKIDIQSINNFLDNIIKDKIIKDKIINKKYISKDKIDITSYNNNDNNILNNLVYNDIPKKLLRIYKLFMNRLFTVQNIRESLTNYNKEIDNKVFTEFNFNETIKPQISSFRYYVTQDHKIHILSDCKENYKFYETGNYKHAIIDTLNILNILLSTRNDNNTKLILLANYLLNYTYSLFDDTKYKIIEISDTPSDIDKKLKNVSTFTQIKCIAKSTNYILGNIPSSKNIKKYFKAFETKKDLLYANTNSFNDLSELDIQRIDETVKSDNITQNVINNEMMGGYYYKKYLKYKQKYIELKKY